MLWLLLGRLAWAVPTLFGISLVTFALVHLAPGEVGADAGPTQGGMATQESRERLRRTHGFDLPLFLNLSVQDRGRRVRSHLAELEAPETAARAEAALFGLTTLAFPELIHAQERSAPGPRRNRLRRLVGRILEALEEPGREALAAGPQGGYSTWWRARAPGFSPSNVRKVSAGIRAGDPGAALAVRRIHQRAVPRLLEDLLAAGTSPVERQRLTAALAKITGHVVLYDPAAPAAERRSVLGQWRDWWRSEETLYRDLSPGDRFWGAFTRTRYARWLGRLASGDFGESVYYRQRAWDVIVERLPVTLWLNLSALLVAYLVGIPLGVFSATRRGTATDRTLGGFVLLLYSLPAYWVGLMLVTYLGGLDGPALFPSGGLRSFHPENAPLGSLWLDTLWHAVLPVFCLAYGALAVVSRYQRAGMVDALGQDYVRTARAKGLTEGRVVWRHGFPNGVLPVINLLGLQIPFLLSGSVIVETIFDLPGLGSLTLVAIHQRDPNVLLGIISLVAVLTLVSFFLADLLMMWADPRIRLTGEDRR